MSQTEVSRTVRNGDFGTGRIYVLLLRVETQKESWALIWEIERNKITRYLCVSKCVLSVNMCMEKKGE